MRFYDIDFVYVKTELNGILHFFFKFAVKYIHFYNIKNFTATIFL